MGLSPENVEHFRKWLRIGTGCGFAASLASEGRIAYEAHDEMPPVDELDTSLDVYATAERSTIFIFPFVTNEQGLVTVLNALHRGSKRWRIVDRGTGTAGQLLVGLDWVTAGNDVSAAMGFAPLPSMPVPRRAPYFAIGAWAGHRCNPERGTPPTPRAKPGTVSFLDARHELDHDAYDAMWKTTEATVADLMIFPADDAGAYRQVAFGLDAFFRDQITFT